MSKTMTERLNIETARTRAFDLMADVSEIQQWNGSVTRAEKTSSGPIGTGTQFVTVNRGQELKSTITRYERPDRLAFDVEGKAMDLTGTFTFEESDGMTTLIMEFDPPPKGVMSVLFPVLRPLIKRDLAKQHANFKALCETEAE